MPPKTFSKEPRRRSARLEKREVEEKKRTNLKDLLKRGTSSLEERKRKQAENDTDFTFKRAGLSSNKVNGSTSNADNKSSSQPTSKKGNVRKLQAEDMLITPDKPPQKKQKQKQATTKTVSRYDDYEEHSTSMQITLPVSDTPIIRRNKELRNGPNGRRSSLNNRGKRVSSIGNGFEGVPHDQVPITDFHKHLDTSIPPPQRMRQLLTWCTKRLYDEHKTKHVRQKNKLTPDELTVMNISDMIKKELKEDLEAGKIPISWYNRDEEAPPTTEEKTLLPNERNVKNAQTLEQLTSRLATLQAACGDWEKNMTKHIELPPVSLENVQPSHVVDGNAEFANVLDKSTVAELGELEETAFKEITENMEFSMDSFNDFVHQLKSSSQARQRFSKIKSEKLTQILDATFDDNTIHKINHNDMNRDLDTHTLLKAFSRLSN